MATLSLRPIELSSAVSTDGSIRDRLLFELQATETQVQRLTILDLEAKVADLQQQLAIYRPILEQARAEIARHNRDHPDSHVS